MSQFFTDFCYPAAVRRHAGPLLAGLLLTASAARAQDLTVTSLSPARNAVAAPRTTPVAVGFNQALANSAATRQALAVFGAQTGKKAGPAAVSGNTLTFAPAQRFQPGEAVQVTVPKGVQSSGGQALLTPQVFQFTADATPSTPVFTSGAEVGLNGKPAAVVVGDVDNDGDQDVLTVSDGPTGLASTVSVLLNDGAGGFSVGSQFNPAKETIFVAANLTLGDVDGDGDLDALIFSVYKSDGIVYVQRNDGAGHFSGGQTVAFYAGISKLLLGDVDGDGDLDLVAAQPIPGVVSTQLNAGDGTFTAGQTLKLGPTETALTAALGDIDNDGDLDLVITVASRTIYIGLNNGDGAFNISSYPGAGGLLGDVDGNGTLDLVGTGGVRLNTGGGNFAAARQPDVIGAALADVDGDGDLDVVVVPEPPGINGAVRVRLNDGRGTFAAATPLATVSGIGDLGFGEILGKQVALGDVDGDGTLDLLAAGGPARGVSVRFNQTLRSAPTPASSIRLHAGGSAVATSFAAFAADQYYDAANSAAFTTTTPISGTPDPALYQTERFSTHGTLAYALPVANGSYSVVLHFAELYWTKPGQRVFDAALEGTKVLDHYDIVKKVGPLTATTETFAVTVTDGVLNLDLSVPYLSGGMDQAKLSALEVLPVLPAATRLRAGGGALATTRGAFATDQYFDAASATAATAAPIAGTPDPALYQTERYGTDGTLAYAVPVANGQYTVVLHFAEFYWTKPGQRVFDATLEGKKVLDHYDIVGKVGPLAATTETFAVTVADGVLNLDLSVPYLSGGADQPKISAIEVLSGSPAQAASRGALTGAAAKGAAPLAAGVYPNPSTGRFTLVCTAPVAQAATLLLTDQLGRVVQQRQVQLQTGPNALAVLADGATPGLYQLVLRTADGKSQRQKVLIQP